MLTHAMAEAATKAAADIDVPAGCFVAIRFNDRDRIEHIDSAHPYYVHDISLRMKAETMLATGRPVFAVCSTRDRATVRFTHDIGELVTKEAT